MLLFLATVSASCDMTSFADLHHAKTVALTDEKSVLQLQSATNCITDLMISIDSASEAWAEIKKLASDRQSTQFELATGLWSAYFERWFGMGCYVAYGTKVQAAAKAYLGLLGCSLFNKKERGEF